MTKTKQNAARDLANKLEQVILKRADQSEPGRRHAYQRLGQILGEGLSSSRDANLRALAAKLLDDTIIQVEYRLVNRSKRAAEPRSAAEADILIDQLAFLKSSDDLEFGYGPRYGVEDGKLVWLASNASAKEAEGQRVLHNRLKISTKRLARLMAPARNQYPILFEVIGEYEELLTLRTEELDITSLWSVGDALSSLSSAYRRQNPKGTLATPLEPDLHGVLDNVVREHGAFIMGFEEARTLIERADQFQMTPDLIKQIEPPGRHLLEELSGNRELVTDKTLALHRAILATVDETGWSAGRSGFNSYLVVRNAISAIIRATIGSELSLVGIAAATSLLAEANGISHREFLINGSSVLRAQASNILAFFAHSREFLDYVSWALELLERDDNVMGRRAN